MGEPGQPANVVVLLRGVLSSLRRRRLGLGVQGSDRGQKNIKNVASLGAETFTVTFSKAELYE